MNKETYDILHKYYKTRGWVVMESTFCTIMVDGCDNVEIDMENWWECGLIVQNPN